MANLPVGVTNDNVNRDLEYRDSLEQEERDNEAALHQIAQVVAAKRLYELLQPSKEPEVRSRPS
jgi:hypothetical protein